MKSDAEVALYQGIGISLSLIRFGIIITGILLGVFLAFREWRYLLFEVLVLIVLLTVKWQLEQAIWQRYQHTVTARSLGRERMIQHVLAAKQTNALPIVKTR
jgi:hypothetical protein